MHIGAVPIQKAIPYFIRQVIHYIQMLQEQVCRQVFSKRVTPGRIGYAKFFRNFCRCYPERVRQHNVDDIRAAHRFCQDLSVRLCELYAVFSNISVQRPEVNGRYNIVTRYTPFFFIRTHHVHVMPARAHASNKIHSRNGRAVVFRSKNVTHNRNVHRNSPPSGFSLLDMMLWYFGTPCSSPDRCNPCK